MTKLSPVFKTETTEAARPRQDWDTPARSGVSKVLMFTAMEPVMLPRDLTEVTTTAEIQVIVIRCLLYGATQLTPARDGTIAILSQVAKGHANGRADAR